MQLDLLRPLRKARFGHSQAYWERRYANGGDSGAGSSGDIAAFKAETINRFVRDAGVDSVVELGCGDGRQLGLARYPAYVGLDVSPTAVRRCAERFSEDHTKSFLAYDPEAFVNHGAVCADVALSLDVIFHLVEDRTYETYMRTLFGLARRFVIVFSTNRPSVERAAHIRHRAFLPWVTENAPAWVHTTTIENPFKGSDSKADFFIFARAGSEAGPPSA